MILALNKIVKSFADELILDDINLTINENDRIGLVGANGAGKTTLLNIICKKSEGDSGEVSYKAGLSVGYLEQGGGISGDKTIIEEALSVFSDLLALQEKMRCLEEEISACAGQEDKLKELSEEYASASAFFEQRGGYNIDVRVKTVLNGMGFDESQRNRRADSLSGGEKTRLALAKLLLEQPELLILDEPTNHLDFKTLMWLEDYLSGYKGALLLVSHDRYFLDKLVSVVWEVSEAKVGVFKGNYTKYKLLKEEQLKRQSREYEQIMQKRDAMLEYARKNIARASTSNSAKGRLKQLANMEEPKKPKPAVKPPEFSFVFDKEPVKEVLKTDSFDLTVGEKKRLLAENLSFTVRRGEKVALIGDNGTGKSTLLKALVNGYNNGSTRNIKWGLNSSVSYYDQENKNLNFNNTLFDELHRHFPLLSQTQVRTLLGQVRLSDDNVFKKVSAVSGGERARLGLAIVMAKKANTVVLDEPTNHLDLISKEALEKALCDFEGTLIFVSHDRYFLNSVPTRIIELTNDGVNFYNGGFDEFMAQKEKTELTGTPPKKPEAKNADSEAKSAYYKTKTQRSEEAKRRSRLKTLEKQTAEKEREIERLEREISDPQNAADYGRLSELCALLSAAREQYDSALEEWLLLSE